METQLGESLVTKRFSYQCVICQDLSSAQINQKHLLTWTFHLPGSHRDHQEQSSLQQGAWDADELSNPGGSHSPWDLGFFCCDCRKTESIMRDLVIKIYITPNTLFSSHFSMLGTAHVRIISSPKTGNAQREKTRQDCKSEAESGSSTVSLLNFLKQKQSEFGHNSGSLHRMESLLFHKLDWLLLMILTKQDWQVALTLGFNSLYYKMKIICIYWILY